ncbi:MAG: sigma-70 family RNA polymerase sigma factor [Arachidicoccus sp.]|nr:sigma-70 family RNA polymerase sigma factor [Arachidicoccus sp.]
MITNLTDIELLEMLRNDNSEAFRTLYERYHHAIYRNIMLLLHDEYTTADLVQEVFLILWEKRKKLSYDKAISGWLFTVSYYKTIDYIRFITRSNKNLNQLFKKEDLIEPAEKENSFEQHYTLLDEAIKRLPLRCRRAFELCKLQGLSYEEASVMLGISKYTINEYMKEALSFLRKYVNEHSICYFPLLLPFFF